jgi:hypothetical protein
MIKSPFKFLDSYTITDRNIFFGRDQEITELYRRVFESKMLLVYGVSGTGKSSLINCGLASRFDESDWLPINVRRGSSILTSVDTAIKKQALTPLKDEVPVSEKLKSLYLDHFKPVFLIFDQFEELFIFGSSEEKTSFIKLLKEIIESKVQCRIILVIREEFLAGITEFEFDLPEIFANRFRVEKMKRANALHAIEGPCQVHKIETEPGFSEELINKLCPAGNDIELTFLQIYLDRVFRLAVDRKDATGNLRFTKALLDSAGSVSDLLGQFLEEQIREMDDPETVTAILKSFVSVQGTKQQMTETEILDSMLALGTNITEPLLVKYLNRFVDLRLIREKDESGHYELRHDSLASKIYEKFTSLEKDIIEVRQFLENAYNTYEKRGKLLTVEDLKYIAPYEDKLFLNKNSEEFIDKSKNEITRARRRRRTIATVAGIALILVLSGFTIWAINERKKAVREREIAEVQKEIALTANDIARSAESEALKEKNRALENEKISIKAKKEAEIAKVNAINAESHALLEKNRALIEQSKATSALQAKLEAEAKFEATARDFVISPDSMNILYKGIENPISFAISGVSSGRLYFRAEHAEIQLGKGKFYIIPLKIGDLNISLFLIKGNDTIKLGTRLFKVKNLPIPIPYIAGKRNGYILKDSLVNATGINVITPDFEFKANYKILGYTLTAIRNHISEFGFVYLTDETVKFDDCKKYLQRISNNQQINFENILVVGPDSLIKNIGSINLIVVEKMPWYEPQFFKTQVKILIDQKNWQDLRQVVNKNVEYYMSSPAVLNTLAYWYFLYVNDSVDLSQALQWAERAVKISREDPMTLDTYASLLFKLGYLDKAEEIELKAINKLKARNEPIDLYEKLLKQIQSSR